MRTILSSGINGCFIDETEICINLLGRRVIYGRCDAFLKYAHMRLQAGPQYILYKRYSIDNYGIRTTINLYERIFTDLYVRTRRKTIYKRNNKCDKN